MAFWKGAGARKKTEQLEFFGNGISKPTNWKKGDCIGAGAFGKVFKASIKTRYSGTLHLAVKEESVKKETEALKKLSHERIITYYGFHATNESFFIFIELMECGSLEHFINAKYDSGERIDELQAGRITKQIIEGIVYLNENKLFHRDIKSANILMSDENNVKLADFGLTREFAEMTKTYTKGVGTNRFMAPEMVAIKDDGSNYNYDKSVDIWAIGCLVIHMLTGNVPFAKLTDVQVIFKLGQQDPSPAKDILSQVSESCRRFFNKTLVRDPKARASAASLLNESFVTGEKLPELETDAGKEGPDEQLEDFNVTADNWNEQQLATSSTNSGHVEEFDARDATKQHQSAMTNIAHGLVEEFDVRDATKQHQSAMTNIAHGPQYQYNFQGFQGAVNFNSERQVNRIDNLSVERLENFKADQVGNVEVGHASAKVAIGQADAVSAQANELRIGNVDTVKKRETNYISVGKAETIISNQTKEVKADEVKFLVVESIMNMKESSNL